MAIIAWWGRREGVETGEGWGTYLRLLMIMKK